MSDNGLPPALRVSRDQLHERARSSAAVRRARADFLRPLRNREVPPRAVFQLLEQARMPGSVETLGKIRVTTLLTAVPGVGARAAEKIVTASRVPPTKYVSTLTPGQVARLTAEIEALAARRGW